MTLHDSPRAGIVYIVGDSSILTSNMVQPIPGGWGSGLLFGFSQGMLGVTGFETAANYIEEQRKGVYVKTLRNMWWCVRLLTPTPRPKPFTHPAPNPSHTPPQILHTPHTRRSVFILNPIISLVCIGTLPLDEIVSRPNDVMTRMALKSGGYVFR